MNSADLCVTLWERICLIFIFFGQDVEDIWTTPVGDITMVSLVSYVTLIITTLCTIFLVQTIGKSVPRQHPKRE
ncbi:hypothetical protein ANTQUA_LOCUS693 [Anthophora quadrimaculata]